MPALLHEGSSGIISTFAAVGRLFTLTLSFASTSEMPIFADMRAVSLETEQAYKIAYPFESVSRHDLAHFLYKMWSRPGHIVMTSLGQYLKVTRSDTTDIVAHAAFCLRNAALEGKSPIDWAPPPYPIGTNVPFLTSYLQTIADGMAKIQSKLPAFYIEIYMLCTVKEFERLGCATAMLKWAEKKAIELQAPLFVIATPIGYELYRKMGFKILHEEMVLVPPEQKANGAQDIPLRYMIKDFEIWQEPPPAIPITRYI